MSRIVIFCGAPGSGKSTLSEIVAERLEMERICEDELKVELYERKGGATLSESDRYSERANELLFDEIERRIAQGEDVICEATFDRPGNAERISRWATDGYDVRIIVCQVSERERKRRFLTRPRHPAHHDPEREFKSHHFDYFAMPDPKLFLDTDASIASSVETVLDFL
jgi:predicted kinase